MSAQKGPVRGAVSCLVHPGTRAWHCHPRRAHNGPTHLQRMGPCAGVSFHLCARRLQERMVGSGPGRPPRPRPPRPRVPLTGGQVPLVEVLQLGAALPLALLSRSLLHTGGHRVGPTWGHTDCVRTDPTGAQSPPSCPCVQGTPHPPLGPQQSQPRDQLQITLLHPVTFLERPSVQGVEGVQALPGVWGLLSKEHRQTLGRWRTRTLRAPSPHSLTLSEVTAEDWPHSIQDLGRHRGLRQE